MKIPIPKMKRKGCIKLYRWEFDLLKKLTDPEYRLYIFYRQAVDWDKKHERFGSILISLRGLHSEYFNIPDWSLAKLSRVRRKLIEKNLLRLADDYIHVENMRIFQEKVVIAEQLFKQLERGIPVMEADVQLMKQMGVNTIKELTQKLAQKMDISKSTVPPTKHSAG